MRPPARNAPCACGSGRRFKHCCGRPSPLRAAVTPGRSHAVALVNQGNTLARQGSLTEALRCYDDALAADATLAAAHLNRGHVLAERQEYAAALQSFARASTLEPGLIDAHLGAGEALLVLGQAAAAAQCIRRALDLEPRSFAAHDALGRALHGAGDLDGAVLAYGAALRCNVAAAPAHNNLGSVLRAVGRLDEAERHLARAIELDPRCAEAHRNLALVLRLKGQSEDARASCHRALDLEPSSAATLVILADIDADLGEFAAAERLYRRALRIDPRCAQAWVGIVRGRRMTPQDGEWLEAVERLVGEPTSPHDEAHLRYALGKYFDDLGDYDGAFAQYRRANELRKRRRQAKPALPGIEARVARIVQQHDPAWIRDLRCEGAGSERCIFVVGMLRSGTTLAEQILASHPAARGVGEHPFWSTALEASLSIRTGPAGRAFVDAHGRRYRQLLDRLAPEAARTVDKMPSNFLSLGLIHAALPEARIIHMQRHPGDVCLSIFFQDLETTLDYTADLADLAHYYQTYAHLMHHWRRTLPPGTLLEVPYEGLVREQEHWTRRLLEHARLDWDARCLDFHHTPRAIVTASRWQARQPMNPGSIGRWRRYARHLGALKPLLDGAPD